MSVHPSPPRRGRARSSVLLGLAIVLLATGVPLASPAAARPGPTYRPPVDAPVSDPFRAPTTPYGPGNRGLEYDTAPGTEVRAAADGVVTFAGLVAGARHVTVLHPDGLRTTASRLATVDVVTGQTVHQGDRLGATLGRLHFGARRGASYLDPASLFVEGPPEVHLVPFDQPPGDGDRGERSAIGQLLGLGRAAIDLLGAGATLPGDVADWVGERGEALVATAGEYLPQFLPVLGDLATIAAIVEAAQAAWAEARRPCTRSDVPLPPPADRRIAVLIAGLGSTSGRAGIDGVDTAGLGYAAEDVVRFSYAGGRTPDSPGRPDGVPSRSYAVVDSQQDLHESGRRLADLVEGVAASAPGVPIDLVAHSQGGLVARLTIAELERRGASGAIGLLATIATPHQGAPLATAAFALGTTEVGRLAETVAGGMLGLDPDAPSAAQLSEGSDVVAELERTPLPAGLGAISVAGRADLVVPVGSTRLDGARSVVIPDGDPFGHDQLPADPRTTREVALALAGAPPGCRSILDAVLDQVVGTAIAEVESGAGAVTWIAAGIADAKVGLPARAATALVDR